MPGVVRVGSEVCGVFVTGMWSSDSSGGIVLLVSARSEQIQLHIIYHHRPHSSSPSRQFGISLVLLELA